MTRMFVCLVLVSSVLTTFPEISSTADPPPETYAVGEIPSQWVREGKTLRLIVAPPKGMPPPISISASIQPLPFGAVSFDPASRLFQYTPDPNDRKPFQVTFEARGKGQNTSQSVALNPLLQLPAEDSVLGLVPVQPFPDPASKDYLMRNEVLS